MLIYHFIYLYHINLSHNDVFLMKPPIEKYQILIIALYKKITEI
jgi:hypothetical protein